MVNTEQLFNDNMGAKRIGNRLHWKDGSWMDVDGLSDKEVDVLTQYPFSMACTIVDEAGLDYRHITKLD